MPISASRFSPRRDGQPELHRGSGPAWPRGQTRRRAHAAARAPTQVEVGLLERAARPSAIRRRGSPSAAHHAAIAPRQRRVGRHAVEAIASPSSTDDGGRRAGRRRASAADLRRRQRPLEAEPEPRPDARGELGGRARGDDPAVDEDRDPVGQPLDVGQVVAGEQDRDAVAAQVRDDPPGRGPALGVHPGGGFVEDARPRAARPGRAPGRAAAARRRTAAGSGVRATVPEPDQVQQLVGVARVRVERRVLAQRLARPGAHVDAAALEHQADPGAERRGRPRAGSTPRTRTVPPSAAAVALDDLDGRGLARAVRPEQRHDLAGRDRRARRRRRPPGRRSA